LLVLAFAPAFALSIVALYHQRRLPGRRRAQPQLTFPATTCDRRYAAGCVQEHAGLTKAQSVRMVEDFHVYMLDSGRINVAGLNEATVPILADAIHAVVTTPPTARI
jgi:hypothetical protein